jgi:hypothetical protein
MTYFRIPIRGWKKCVHEAAAFESGGEYAAAVLLDSAKAVVWWLRNDPPILKIPSPTGNLEPDFVYRIDRKDREVYGVLEVKSDVFWDGPGSEAQVKANAAREWARAVNKAKWPASWEFAVVLDQEALAASSFEALREDALIREPAEPGAV